MIARYPAFPAIALTAALAPATAYALEGLEQASGFVQGLAHPIAGLDHAAAIGGVGVVAALLSGRARWLLPLTFLVGMAFGAAWGANRFDLPEFETGIALSLVVIGLAIASGLRMPIGLAAGLAAVLAFPHGYAHGTEMPLEASGAGYVAGFLGAAAAQLAIGVVIGVGIARLSEQSALLARCGLGAAIALIGIGFLGGWL